MYKCPICFKKMEFYDESFTAHCKECGVYYDSEQIKKLIRKGVNEGPKWTRQPYYVHDGILTYTIHGIQHADIPEGIVEIKTIAFQNREVNTVIVPDTVERIGESAFDNCRFLEKIYLGSGIKEIKKNAFSNCFALKEVHIKDLQTWFDIELEYDRTSYLNTSPLSPSSARLFVDGKEVKHLIIPSNTTLKNLHFLGCSSIEKVTIENNVWIEGRGIFEGCYNINTVIFEGGIKDLDKLCLPKNCEVKSLKENTKPQEKKETLTQPTNYAKLGEEAFKILDSRKAKGVCQYCGGDFTLFTKKCKFCGKKKDY